ncbi:hypothetical protein [Oceanobacillus jeddahense]|uniref:hypothetical protein n=1 Tax=Oceanobacillus jeddahense TaxID=1462527 RepID=UPI0005961399|nr:hypothetical protein [Oceanobacillus jeddahense]
MYRLMDNNAFVMEGFQRFHPFSSFLPGIAGKSGIPLWAFYVNRGQAMAGFGIRDKNSMITEFFPADKAYQMVPIQGFRTFIKLRTKEGDAVFEPFSFRRDNETVSEELTINENHLQLKYDNKNRGLVLTVEYFTLPQAPLAGLVREVTLENIDHEEKELEIVDGLATVLPSGLSNSTYKEISNTLKSWFDVETIDNQFNFYHLRGSTEDNANVSKTYDGNFYSSLAILNGKEKIVKPFYDRALIFGKDLTLQYPDAFHMEAVSSLTEHKQVPTNKVSGGFTLLPAKLASGDKLRIVSLIGYGENRETIKQFIHENFRYEKVFEYKNIAKTITDNLTSVVTTKTAEPLFDAYVNQNYLDNGLRGGFPMVFQNKKKNHIFYLYSRKHGDLERDYNFFSISPSFYSQGNGNYRDINQNRRLDVIFNPKLKDYNIKHFVNLLQLDGYNPLFIKEVQYKLNNNMDFSKYGLSKAQNKKLSELFRESFAPGDILKFVQDHSISLAISFETFLTEILSNSEESLEAEHGEGFWIDHWTYNLDLLDSYLAIYPDKTKNVFFDMCYRFFDSPAYVQPRAKKYIQKEGKLRQSNAVHIDEGKQQEEREGQWVRSNFGEGNVYETNLFSKLFLLAAIKTSTIAPLGLGIEMEAGKPGWNDALNGLPGMFGASTSELYELKRLLKQLQHLSTLPEEKVKLPEEVYPLIAGLETQIRQSDKKSKQGQLKYWNEVSRLRETYRSSIKDGISGYNLELSMETVMKMLAAYQQQVDDGIERVEMYQDQELIPTYFYFEIKTDSDNLGQINECKPYAVTPFLEGIVKKLKLSDRLEEAKSIYDAVRRSPIFDEKLGMYKTSMPISEETVELGRAKFFTPGWLENESVFMHMEYKYLLELLNKGLFNAFFNDIRSALVPFMDPEKYGRSILENVSFIASSANPDASIHGKGYVARLSGSTIEFLNMWVLMFIGKQPFMYDKENDLLHFRLEPVLPSWLFREDGTVSFMLFGCIEVTYHNDRRCDSFGEDGVVPVGYIIIYKDGKKYEVSEAEVIGPLARDIRNLTVAKIIVKLK